MKGVKFYKSVNNMKRGFQPRMMNGEDGKILERWLEYCTEMLNGEDYKRNLIVKLDNELEQPKEICKKKPTRQGIGYAIQRMRNNRAPEQDTIVAELIEYGGEGVLDTVHELIKLIWTTKNMPQEWNTRIIYPIYKKGDKLECKNYRGITLLNNA
jgi:hypothetical protein